MDNYRYWGKNKERSTQKYQVKIKENTKKQWFQRKKRKKKAIRKLTQDARK